MISIPFISSLANIQVSQLQMVLSLETFPERGTAIPGRASGLRVVGFEWRVTILFRVTEDEVNILRTLYGGRDIGPHSNDLPEQ